MTRWIVASWMPKAGEPGLDFQFCRMQAMRVDRELTRAIADE
jgi:hypothetical protein